MKLVNFSITLFSIVLLSGQNAQSKSTNDVFSPPIVTNTSGEILRPSLKKSYSSNHNSTLKHGSVIKSTQDVFSPPIVTNTSGEVIISSLKKSHNNNNNSPFKHDSVIKSTKDVLGPIIVTKASAK